MIQGQRVILYNATKGSRTLTIAPDGFFSLEYVLTRSEKYHGMFNQFSGSLGFSGDDKTWIDAVITDLGKEAEVTFTYYIQDPETLVYETFITGLLNFYQYSRQLDYTYVPFESTSFKQKVNRRQEIEVNYNNTLSIERTSISAFTYINLLCQGLSANIVTKSVYPHELFDSVIRQITDINYTSIYSELLGRTDISYSEITELVGTPLRRRMITKGSYLRGYTESDQEYITVSLSKLFDIFNSQKPIGLGFSTDSVDRDIVVIEEREHFYQPRIIITLEDSRIEKDSFRIEPGTEFQHNQYEIGSKEDISKDIDNGLSEYNVKSTYSTTSKNVISKLELINPARIDGVGINDIIDNYQKGANPDKSEYDQALWVVDSLESTGSSPSAYTMKNYKYENYDSKPTGISGGVELFYNLDLSPARILIKEYGKILNISLQDLTGYLKHNKAETLSKLVTLRTGDALSITEKEDILLSILDTPIMTGNLIYFNYAFSYSEIKTIQDDPYGQVRFYKPNTATYIGGWFKELSTNPTDESTNVILYEAKTLAELVGYELNEDGGYALSEDGSFVILE